MKLLTPGVQGGGVPQDAPVHCVLQDVPVQDVPQLDPVQVAGLVVTRNTDPVPFKAIPLRSPGVVVAVAGGTNTDLGNEPPLPGSMAMVNPPADAEKQLVSELAEGMTVFTMNVSPSTIGLKITCS